MKLEVLVFRKRVELTAVLAGAGRDDEVNSHYLSEEDEVQESWRVPPGGKRPLPSSISVDTDMRRMSVQADIVNNQDSALGKSESFAQTPSNSRFAETLANSHRQPGETHFEAGPA